jgi:peptidoglycan/xylan/chitin deacetylase (PgdA/CDA1 family)
VKLGAVVLVMLALGASSDAAGKVWPKPAAGEPASGGPEVLFTFDDGPNPRTTPLVLDTLARYRVRAVFFLVGYMTERRNPRVVEVVQRILREGHVIATHTMNHADLCDMPEPDAVLDLDDGKAVVEKISGMPTAWFRAPFGARCDQLENMLAVREMTHFHWDLDPQEWRHGSATRTFRYVTQELSRAQGRNVLLLHDVKLTTVKALPQILDWIAVENTRRAGLHLRPIRILQAPDLAVEQLPKGLGEWLLDVTAGARALPDAIASVLPGR